MFTPELFLLSPYTVPAENPFLLNDEDTASFLNGYTALWHPAVLHLADGPPRVASPYDHEQPVRGNVYAVPESPPLVLPDDWEERVRDAGAVFFRSTPERDTTLANLRVALESAFEQAVDWQWAFHTPILSAVPVFGNGGQDKSNARSISLGSFFGLGFGYIHLLALVEAMHHENEPRMSEFWPHVASAMSALRAGDAETCRKCLQSAAAQLQTVRETVYPAAIHFLDFCIAGTSRPPHPEPPAQGGRETDRSAPSLRAKDGDRHSHEGRGHRRKAIELQAALARGTAFNLVASASVIESLAADDPEFASILRDRVACRSAEVCGGVHRERQDALLPLESQLWNLLQGLSSSKQLLGDEIRVFGRQHTWFYPETPLVLTAVGLQRALLLAFDDAALPSFQGAVINWPAQNGQQIQAFTRMPYTAEKPSTYFHLGHYLHRTIMHDHVAVVAFLHGRQPGAVWHGDLIELSSLAPVLGQWTTISSYLDEVYSPEQAGTLSGDDFQTDFLSDRIEAGVSRPVSEFAEHLRLRRRLDTAWTLAGMYHSLMEESDGCRSESVLRELEEQLETGREINEALDGAIEEKARALAERIVARSANQQSGYLVFNPCAYARRLPLELPDVHGLLPTVSPLKACQAVDGRVWVVADVPALGFTWITGGPPLNPNPSVHKGEGDGGKAPRMRLADSRHVRNEFFEAEVDPTTGGLRGLWDHRTRANRIGQQLVFNPGSIMQAKDVRMTSSGPALGEILTEGLLVTNHGEELATFRQRFRAWLGRPVLEVRIEIFPHQEPRGYPWHAYYGARFAWRDERALLVRGSNGFSDVTNHIRPSACDYLEIRQGRQSTGLYLGGLPFQQRHGSRMLDVILVSQNEKARVFELALGLDREHPAQTAQGIVTPAPLVSVSQGPPAGGPTGWLFHLDSPNLLLTSLRLAPGGAGVLARIKECEQHGGSAELRCPRPPRRARLQNARGELLQSAETREDAVLFEMSSGDLVDVLIEFQ
jgi:hypothetical protein